MKNEDFEKLLKQSKMNKKEFANMVEMNYTSVTNWASNDNVPNWVRTWLENYIAKCNYEKIKTTLRNSGACED